MSWNNNNVLKWLFLSIQSYYISKLLNFLLSQYIRLCYDTLRYWMVLQLPAVTAGRILIKLASRGNIVAQHLHHHPRVKGSSRSTNADIMREIKWHKQSWLQQLISKINKMWVMWQLRWSMSWNKYVIEWLSMFKSSLILKSYLQITQTLRVN